MKKLYLFSTLAMIAALLFSINLSAQETTVTVKVEKDGKLVKDTTYQFDDADQAKHALKMMEIMSGDDEHMMKVHKDMAEHDGEHVKVIKYVVESDGDEDVHIQEIIEKHGEGENVKVIVVKKKTGECEGHEPHDHDHDEEVEVEVKVEKK